MQKDLNHNKAMEMLNQTLYQMKEEMSQVDKMHLHGPKKKIAKHMHEIYAEINGLVSKYSHSHNYNDFNDACQQITVLQPAFVLDYNEAIG